MIGIDLVYIPEFQRQLDIGGIGFIRKTFHASEMKSDHTEHLAGLWAAKEAVAKAAASMPQKWTEITITHDISGKPSARFGSQKFAISIAHHGEYAVAVANVVGA